MKLLFGAPYPNKKTCMESTLNVCILKSKCATRCQCSMCMLHVARFCVRHGVSLWEGAYNISRVLFIRKIQKRRGNLARLSVNPPEKNWHEQKCFGLKSKNKAKGWIMGPLTKQDVYYFMLNKRSERLDTVYLEIWPPSWQVEISV